jgi:MoaA/NifB/PqqE/SkfB family radical SAM enzyme
MWDQYIEFARECDIKKIDLGFVKLLGWASPEHLLPKTEVINIFEQVRLRAERAGLAVNNFDLTRSHHRCSVRQTNMAIFPDGSVSSCSFDLEPWGNVYEQDLRTIWQTRMRLDGFCDRCARGGYLIDHRQC